MGISKLGRYVFKGLKPAKNWIDKPSKVSKQTQKKLLFATGTIAAAKGGYDLYNYFFDSKLKKSEYLDIPGILTYKPEEYTMEILQKKYPPDKYTIETINEWNFNQKKVMNKSTGKPVLEVSGLYEDGDWDHLVCEYDKNGEEQTLCCYDSDNNLQRYDDKDGIHYPVADMIYRDISAKTKLGLPTTGKDLEKHIKMITPENVDDVVRAYKENYGKNIEDAINSEYGLKDAVKRRLIGHISDCYEEKCGYKKNGFVNEHSQVKNDYYTGDEYSVVQKGNIITVTNKSTGKVSELNLYDLTKDLPIAEKARVKALFQKLPGEVIADFVSEGITSLNIHSSLINGISEKNDNGTSTQAYYSTDSDDITLMPGHYVDSDQLVHELGHAIDHRGRIFNDNVTNENSQFYKTYQKEIAAFKKAGNKTYNEVEIKIFSNAISGAYITSSELEAFAECYTFLMTGHCSSENALKKFFPKTLEQAKIILQKTRQLKDSDRRKIKLF